MVKFCPECGTKAEDISKFCTLCGKQLDSKELVTEEEIKSTTSTPLNLETNTSKKPLISPKANKVKLKDLFKHPLVILLLVFFIITLLFSFLEINSLSSISESFQSSYYDTLNQYYSLSSSNNDLQRNYSILDNNYESLQSQYNSLQDEYYTVQSQYTSLQNNYNALRSSSSSFEKIVEVRYGLETECNKFITPSDPSVITATQNVLGHSSDGDISWNDMTDINNYVGGNIKYNYDTFNGPYEECWFYPNETLARGYGDCEDHALLMVSMCKAEANVPWIWCAEIRFPAGPGHICVFVRTTGGQLFIFDPTSRPDYFFGYMVHGAWTSETAKTVDLALQQYEQECWGGQSITVTKIFNGNTYQSFTNNQEFINAWTQS